ncbi:GAF and ANTAR domain-containing protein [Streptomyces candidus]|uniref:GAF domain-containing protein n=1 Tax=Streptomyces candidus TaxID=67283 RepID=A0A7X0LQI2_9ACTN|nr:GAF and ANTAR domain-containing protein [Streptomyces candidus]MBB6435946.1 GAF domain-containing protein [Streptomyces candidus]GHH43084.1 RNA-binding protein [Streptomyces candidus]
MNSSPEDLPGRRPPHVVDLLLNSESVEDFLHGLAAAALAHAPDADGCGITLETDSGYVTVTSVGGSAPTLDEEQYGLNDGPCLQAVRTGEEVHVKDLLDEERWGAYPAHALAAGTRSSLSLPVSAHTDIAGALNLYSPQPDGLASSDVATLRALAEQATGALALARKMTRTREFATDLQNAMRYRGVIDQAAGIIMAQQRCSGEQAFAVLRRASQNRNIKLRDLCTDLIIRVTGQPPHDPPELRPPPPA